MVYTQADGSLTLQVDTDYYNGEEIKNGPKGKNNAISTGSTSSTIAANTLELQFNTPTGSVSLAPTFNSRLGSAGTSATAKDSEAASEVVVAAAGSSSGLVNGDSLTVDAGLELNRGAAIGYMASVNDHTKVKTDDSVRLNYTLALKDNPLSPVISGSKSIVFDGSAITSASNITAAIQDAISTIDEQSANGRYVLRGEGDRFQVFGTDTSSDVIIGLELEHETQTTVGSNFTLDLDTNTLARANVQVSTGPFNGFGSAQTASIQKTLTAVTPPENTGANVAGYRVDALTLGGTGGFTGNINSTVSFTVEEADGTSHVFSGDTTILGTGATEASVAQNIFTAIQNATSTTGTTLADLSMKAVLLGDEFS